MRTVMLKKIIDLLIISAAGFICGLIAAAIRGMI